MKVPLLPQAVQLISKYKNHPAAVANETLFSVITFATTVTLSNGIPIESVSKMLGHTSIRTTQIYAKVAEHKLSEDMQNLKLKMASSQR